MEKSILENLKKTKNYYDGISEGYSKLYHNEQILKINKVIDYFPERGLFLDFGSGDGVINKYLGKGIEIVSFDISFNLLELNSNGKKICGNGMNLPFKDDSFDFVSSFTVLQDLPKPKRAVEEIFRVLKKNGLFFVSFLKMSKKYKIIKEKLLENFCKVYEYEEEKDIILVLKKD